MGYARLLAKATARKAGGWLVAACAAAKKQQAHLGSRLLVLETTRRRRSDAAVGSRRRCNLSDRDKRWRRSGQLKRSLNLLKSEQEEVLLLRTMTSVCCWCLRPMLLRAESCAQW